MHYRMRNDLSYCMVDGHAVFLDIAGDRYFQLPGELEQAFLGYAEGSDHSAQTVALLVARNLLVPAPDAASAIPVPVANASPPLRSAHEMPADFDDSAIAAFPEVLATTWQCRRQIHGRPLGDVIGAAIRYRSRRTESTDTLPAPARERRLLHAVWLFHRARRFVPIDTLCLLDSLALSRFLSRRHLYARIVLGVTVDPFSAHCWVQVGDIVLNDTVGNAMAYTVIKVI